MIVDLPDTNTSKVSKALVKIREEGGAVALGRVLTLVIRTAPARRKTPSRRPTTHRASTRCA